MSRSDAHIHLFKRGYSHTRAADAELADYLRIRERQGIDLALVVGYEGEAKFAGNNSYVLGLANAHDWIVPLHFFDLTDISATDVHRALDRGARGVSLYPGNDPEACRRVPGEVWRAIAERRAIVSVNAAPLALASLTDVIPLLGEAPVLISHLGLPGPIESSRSGDDERMRALTRLAVHPHVSVKLSGLYAIDSKYPHVGAIHDVTAVLDAFGPDRIIWGSDFSPGLDVTDERDLFGIPAWLSDLLSAEELDSVLGGALARLIGRN